VALSLGYVEKINTTFSVPSDKFSFAISEIYQGIYVLELWKENGLSREHLTRENFKKPNGYCI